MRNNWVAVRFDIYCLTCKYYHLHEFEDPCNECLESGMNEGTDLPVLWEEDDMKE